MQRHLAVPRSSLKTIGDRVVAAQLRNSLGRSLREARSVHISKTSDFLWLSLDFIYFILYVVHLALDLSLLSTSFPLDFCALELAGLILKMKPQKRPGLFESMFPFE